MYDTPSHDGMIVDKKTKTNKQKKYVEAGLKKKK